MKKIKTAIVGCGMVSDIYLYNMLHKYTVLDVVGCCDLQEERARAMAEKYVIQSLAFEEILADSQIEMVVNLTAPAAHYNVIKQLLQAGKHVYTEKVLALEIEEAKELLDLAQKNNLYLGVAPDTFLGAGIQTGRYVLDAGMIGEPTGCLAVLNRDNRVGAEFIPYIAKRGGGIGFDVGIYYITALSYLMGDVCEVSGFMETREPIRKHMYPSHDDFGEEYEVECENVVTGSLKYRNGALGTVMFNSECIMNPYPQLTIFGTQGILYLPDPDSFSGDVKVLLRGQKDAIVIPHNHGFSGNSRGVGAAEMAWSILGEREPRANKEMAFHSLEVLYGIAASAKTKKTYEMTSSFQRPEPLPRGYLLKSEYADFLADEEEALR